MTTAKRLALTMQTKERIRRALGLSVATPFSEYPNAIAPASGDALLFNSGTIGKLERLSQTKERLRVALNLGTSIPFSQYNQHIKNFWMPSPLFVSDDVGAWYDPSDISSLYQDAAGTIPVTANGDPVGLILDKSGKNHHAKQSISAKRPTYRTDGVLRWLDFDGIDDFMVTDIMAFSKPNVFLSAGILKTASTSRHTLLELSNSVGANTKTFGLTSNEASIGGVGGLLNGTVGQTGRVSGFASEQKLLISARLNVNSEVTSTRYDIRVNRAKHNIALTGFSTLSNGFAPYAVYIGARGGTTTFFKGSLFGLIIKEGLLDDDNLYFVESFMDRKMGQVQ